MGVELKVPKEVMKTSSKASMKLHIITYRTSAFFIPEIPTPEEIVLKQRVLSATVQGVLIKNLSNPIHYTIPNIEVGKLLFHVVSFTWYIVDVFL